MKSALRIAAFALAPVAALLAAQPASANHWDYAQPAQVAPAPAEVYTQPPYGNAWGYRARRDHRAPQIIDMTPSQGERVSDRGYTRISARVIDYGTGVDPSWLVLRIDGRDVSGYTRFDGERVRYREDLAPGRHVAELVVRDRAGNSTREVWSFDVAGWNQPYGWRYGYNGW